MATAIPQDKPPPEPQETYADRLKTNVRWDQRLKRNVLEITLEKSDKNSDSWVDLDPESTARLLMVLGIDIKSQVQGCQVKQRVLSVWMVDGISLDRFCKEESIKVNKDIRTGMIRPAGKTDVTVTISGLDFNTPDAFVFEYLSKFGRIVKNEVIYSKYTYGPLKGKYNGDRKFQVDFTKSGLAMGTYHIIDSCRVRIFYRGNKKTCARCHEFADKCPGAGIAKDCEEKKGQRMTLVNHMMRVWKFIDFKPNSFEPDNIEMDTDSNELLSDKPIREEQQFSPQIVRPAPLENDMQKYEGLIVKNFPKKLDEKEITSFVKEVGGTNLDENTEIRLEKNDRNITAIIEPLSPSSVQTIQSLIHFPETNKKFFGVPLYCRAIRILTPEKSQKNSDLESTGRPIKSKSDELEADDSDDQESEDSFNYVDLQYQFLKDYEEFKSNKKGGKKRGRNTSSPNSETKQKSKKKQYKKNT